MRIRIPSNLSTSSSGNQTYSIAEVKGDMFMDKVNYQIQNLLLGIWASRGSNGELQRVARQFAQSFAAICYVIIFSIFLIYWI
mgnify:CR=1 FL=1